VRPCAAMRPSGRSLGSLNMLGNPLGLVTSLYSGVTDVFKEPAKQLQSGRRAGRQSLVHMGQDLARGLERGALSLLRHSVLGWSNTISKASSSAARFIAYLSMDDIFASEISKAPEDREEPHQIGLMPGLIVGIGSLARVPALAAERAWNHPHLSPWVLFPVPVPGEGSRQVTGVQRLGAALPALLQGSVQAVVCLLAKPLAGVLDTITQTSFSFQDAALAYLGAQAKDASALRQRWQRVRPPRPFGPDKVSACLPSHGSPRLHYRLLTLCPAAY